MPPKLDAPGPNTNPGATPQSPPPTANLAHPNTVAGINDPGDDTQRNFRYQHAYGVILLIASACRMLAYRALYCEHHEDLLAERDDNKFDAYQIKTRRPELGDWQWNDGELVNSVKRFVELDARFPTYLNEFFFVSNTTSLDTTEEGKLHLSPIRLLEQLKSVPKVQNLPKPLQKAFRTLRESCDCDEAALLSVLRRLKLILGPSRDDFGDVVAHSHLPKLPECAKFDVIRLNKLRDELIALVYNASSRAREDAERNFLPLGKERDAARIQAKIILVSDFVARVRERNLVPFRYTANLVRLDIVSAKKNLSVLDKKLIGAGLANQSNVLNRRALEAEQHLIGMLHRLGPTDMTPVDQIITAVQAECDEALLEAKAHGGQVGVQMLLSVYARLKEKAKESAHSASDVPYEVLVGIAALLCGECKVWWGDPFNLDEVA